MDGWMDGWMHALDASNRANEWMSGWIWWINQSIHPSIHPCTHPSIHRTVRTTGKPMCQIGDWMNDWMYDWIEWFDWMNEWIEWLTHWLTNITCINDHGMNRLTQFHRMHHEWMNQRTYMIQWMDHEMIDWHATNDSPSTDWMNLINYCANACMHEWMNEWRWMDGWMASNEQLAWRASEASEQINWGCSITIRRNPTHHSNYDYVQIEDFHPNESHTFLPTHGHMDTHTTHKHSERPTRTHTHTHVTDTYTYRTHIHIPYTQIRYMDLHGWIWCVDISPALNQRMSTMSDKPGFRCKQSMHFASML